MKFKKKKRNNEVKKVQKLHPSQWHNKEPKIPKGQYPDSFSISGPSHTVPFSELHKAKNSCNSKLQH